MRPSRSDERMNDTRLSRYVPAAAIGVVAVMAGWVATRSLQQDFAAYWVAGAARRAGLDPYLNRLGDPAAPDLWDGVAVFVHSRFLYAPIVAELFRVLALAPYEVAKATFTAIMVVAWIGATVATARAVDRRSGLAVALAAGALFYPLHLALERGQIEPLVLLLLAVAFGARVRPALAGAALAAAAAFKPGLASVVLVLATLGRGRTAAAALVGLAAVAVASVAVSGPALAREYAAQVLPRAAFYGEGGDESMLLPPARLAAHADELEAGMATLDGRAYALSAWNGPASASLPRLLAPERSTRLTARAPACLLLASLVAAALVARRRGRSEAREAVLLWAAAAACVVASPAGWIMGLVVALPLVPWLVRSGEGAQTAGGWRLGVGGALVACAVPPPFAGWAAGAGALLVLAAIGWALALPREIP
jgi:hypothetical protein